MLLINFFIYFVVQVCENHVQQQDQCTGHGPAREQHYYFQPRQLYGDIHQQSHDSTISSLYVPRAQFNTSKTEPVVVKFPVIREALASTRQVNDDLKDLAENVKMEISRWLMFARYLGINENDIKQVIQLEDSREICYQFLYKWCRQVGNGATVAALAMIVQELGEEFVWSEAFMKVLNKTTWTSTSF